MARPSLPDPRAARPAEARGVVPRPSPARRRLIARLRALGASDGLLEGRRRTALARARDALRSGALEADAVLHLVAARLLGTEPRG